ncbi:MAG: hypothetical protein NVS3B12_27000 [Acidimicrobiales bacterium]
MPKWAPLPETALPAGIPVGRRVRLPGRGTTWVRETGHQVPGVPTLVLLHGWTATSALNWMTAYGPLGRLFHVVALDQRGHGRGVRTLPLRGFRLGDCADDVAALADAMDLGQIIPVGYSMGGPVAQLTWKRHRERVAGLVLCATAGEFGLRTGAGGARPALARFAMTGGVAGAATALRALPPPLRRRVAMAGLGWRRQAIGLPDWALDDMSRNDPAALIEGFPAIQRFNSLPWLDTIDVPTAVIVTTRDRVVAPRRQRALADAIPGSRTWAVAGDHAACVTDPDRFVPALVDAVSWVTRTTGDR